MAEPASPADKPPPAPHEAAGAPAAGGGGSDPSMEDILASIRRILSEDEDAAAQGKAMEGDKSAQAGGEVVKLDPAMLIEEQAAQPASSPPPAPPAQNAALLAPEAAAAAASSVGSLLRTIAQERPHMQISRGGPTIEDLVREEIRPLLKQWLDQHLPAVVERLVRVEIERVVGRALS